MLKVNNKDTRTTITSLGLYCYHRRNAKPFRVSIINFALLLSMKFPKAKPSNTSFTRLHSFDKFFFSIFYSKHLHDKVENLQV